jgi:hypothetical protein
METTLERTKSTARGDALPDTNCHSMKKNFHSLKKREFVSLQQVGAGPKVFWIAIVSH